MSQDERIEEWKFEINQPVVLRYEVIVCAERATNYFTSLNTGTFAAPMILLVQERFVNEFCDGRHKFYHSRTSEGQRIRCPETHLCSLGEADTLFFEELERRKKRQAKE